MNDAINLIVSILSGLAVCLPLAAKLIQTVREAVRLRQWDRLMQMVARDMETAERCYSSGAERKEWCMEMLSVHADAVGYPLTSEDAAKVSDMIDVLCRMARRVNSPEEVRHGQNAKSGGSR